MPSSSAEFAEKLAFVTGATSGIGCATALAFGAAGADVAVADISGEGVRETAALIESRGGRSLAVTCDVTRTADVKTASDKTVDKFCTASSCVSSMRFP